MNRHPTADIDEAVHQRVRLGVLAVLSEADRAAFTYLRDVLAVTDGNLSAHLRVLVEAGLVSVDKGYEGARPRTWIRATAAGRATFRSEIKALRALVDQYDGGPA